MVYDNIKYFSCYSPNLMEHLVDNGFIIIKEFVHFKTTKTCWVFERTNHLSEHLVEWTQNKKTNEGN